MTSIEEGVPEFEPNLKAGGHWVAKLKVPESIREGVGHTRSRQSLEGDPRSFTWIIEIASQVLFSTSASVHYELLVGRDEKSVDLGFHGVVGSGQGAPGKLEDHQQGHRRNAAQAKGVFSKAVGLLVEDTERLWNKPSFPEWPQPEDPALPRASRDQRSSTECPPQAQHKRQKIHLVVVTHGLHSNTGADMLYLKESIDAAAKQAREDAKQRKAEMRQRDLDVKNAYGRDMNGRTKSTPELAIAPTDTEETLDEDEEHVIVRGFGGNAVKTERGIQYLGKRLAKYVLSITYPDQPYLPVKSSIGKSLKRTLTNNKTAKDGDPPSHKHSSIVKDERHVNSNLPYQITSISFVAHSLGGLVQTYAIAYIQKHSPDFFDIIEPINFIALATPFLGLSNENPIYVRFALDWGLVGRTGQDLGLSWRTPTLARSGWDAVIGGLGQDNRKAQQQPDPGTKPLLRILPTGPAQIALKRFRNRSVYSNVVNDGIVPLRTSCLLFLDWRGLGRVERARRDNGVVGTMVNWGWTEMMGQNASSAKKPFWHELFGDSEDEPQEKKRTDSPDPAKEVPIAEVGEGLDNDRASSPEDDHFLEQKGFQDEHYDRKKSQSSSLQQPPTTWSAFMSFFKPHAGTQHKAPPKKQRIYRRGQVMKHVEGGSEDEAHSDTPPSAGRGSLVRGSSLYTTNSKEDNLEAPPKTTIFEAAGDVLNPPLPPKEFILDPAARPRTIFHDRIYHPDDIPPPPTKRQRTFLLRMSSRDGTNVPPQQPEDSSSRPPSRSNTDMSSNSDPVGSMKIEEKIARAYHKDLSWRKVLVRLEPDAHNNIIVRRMFANAYGWPVVKHLCDTHFAYTEAAQMRDDNEAAVERAKPGHVGVGTEGEQVTGQVEPPSDELIAKTHSSASGGHEDQAKSHSYDSILGKTANDSSKTSKVDASEQMRRDIEKLRMDNNLKEKDNSSPAEDSTKTDHHDRKHTDPSSKRTASEIREARDELSDLVSPVTASGPNSYSSLLNKSTPTSHSSSSNRPNLSHSDSARWSDRFFDGSGDGADDSSDEDEDAEYAREWQKAKARGEEGLLLAAVAAAKEKDPDMLVKKIVKDGKPLTASPKASVEDLRKGAMVASATGAAVGTGEATPPVAFVKDNQDDGAGADPQILSLTGIGLRKSLEEQVRSDEPGTYESAASGRGGVVEQVALAGAKRVEKGQT